MVSHPSRLLTAFTSASSFSFCRTRPCRRTFSPSASPRRPFSSAHRSWSFRSDCSSSESSASYLSRRRLTLVAGEAGSEAAPLPVSGPRSGVLGASPALSGPLVLLPGQRHVGLQPVDDQLDLLVPASPDLFLQLPFPVQQPRFLQGRPRGFGGPAEVGGGGQGMATWTLGNALMAGKERPRTTPGPTCPQGWRPHPVIRTQRGTQQGLEWEPLAQPGASPHSETQD